ncbi:hypothetical protein [Streptomyces sp. 3N207]|uniref:hypothetical protein n=1 Tax=Streptomyces sp. 3N207 TaxID=3457417 RepID=UPI003FD436C0
MASIHEVINSFAGSPGDKQRLAFVLGALDRLARAKTEAFRRSVRMLPTAPFGTIRIKADPTTVRAHTYVRVGQVNQAQFQRAFDEALASTDTDFREAMAAILRDSLDALLGNTAAGESRRDESLITIDGDHIVRVDAMLWLYTFDGAGLTADVHNVFAYGIALSAVKLDEVSDELLRLMVAHMVNRMKGLTRSQREQKRKALYNRLQKHKDGTAEKRKRLAALVRDVNTRVQNPFGISVAADRTLYLASPDTGRIWRIAPGEEATPAAGGGTSYQDGIPALKAKLDRPTDVIAHPTTGGFVIADYGSARLVKVEADGTLHTLAHGSQLPGGSEQYPLVPARLAADPHGVLHVIAYQGDTPQTDLRLLRLPPQGEASVIKQQDLTSPCPLLYAVFGVTVRPTGRPLFGFSACGTVDDIPPGNTTPVHVAGGGQDTGDGVPALTARLFAPCGLDLGPDGTLYIADGWSGESYEEVSRVRAVTPGGTITTLLNGRNFFAVALDSPGKTIYALDDRDDHGRYLLAHALPR